MSKLKYSKEQFQQAVGKSKSIADVCKILGLVAKGNNYETIKKYINLYSLDVSHFTGARWNKGIRYLSHTCLTSLDDILQENVSYSSDMLKKRLIAEGLKQQKCECCGVSEWMGKPLSLELHHINGNHYDNRLNNLQILCPNCHSLTENYCRRNKAQIDFQQIKTYGISLHKHKCHCKYCGKDFDAKKEQIFCCRDHYLEYIKEAQTKQCSYKSKEFLKNALQTYKTICDLAKHFNTSRPTIRKYLKKYKLMSQLDISQQLHSKLIKQCDLNGNVIKIWNSIYMAEKTLNLWGIRDCLAKKTKQSGGFLWEYY